MNVFNTNNLADGISRGLEVQTATWGTHNDVGQDFHDNLDPLIPVRPPIILNRINPKKPAIPQMDLEGPVILNVIAGGNQLNSESFEGINAVLTPIVTAYLRHVMKCPLGVAIGHHPVRYRDIAIHRSADFYAETPAELGLLISEAFVNGINNRAVFQSYADIFAQNLRGLTHETK